LRGGLPRHGLKEAPNTLDEFGATCQRLFPELGNWRAVPEDWFDPVQIGHYTNDLANDISLFRDKHIFRVLVGRAKRGDSVFAVIGYSHVIAQEVVLLQVLGKPVLTLQLHNK